MLDGLRELTALPNLHPALVHFPIAFAIGALVLDLASLVARRQVWLERSAAVLAGLSALGAGGAYLAGRAAADSVGILAPSAEAALGSHSDLGLWTLLVLTAAAVVRVWASVRHGDHPVARLSPVRAVGIALLVVGVGLVVVTADLGGALVFRHGVAVEATSGTGRGTAESPVDAGEARDADGGPERTSGNAGERMVETPDGGLEWTPVAGDGGSLREIVDVEIVSGKGVSPATTPEDRAGMWLEIDGTAVLLLPGEFGDAIVEARLDLTKLDGTVGLLHHTSGAESGTVFEIATADGGARLLRRGEERVLDSGGVELPDGPVELAASVSGHHQKGAADGTVVVHGHADPGAGTRVGLLISGTGRLGIARVAVTPANEMQATPS